MPSSSASPWSPGQGAVTEARACVRSRLSRRYLHSDYRSGPTYRTPPPGPGPCGWLAAALRLDAQRTLATHVLFPLEGEGEGEGALVRLLHAWTAYRPAIGFCQVRRRGGGAGQISDHGDLKGCFCAS